MDTPPVSNPGPNPGPSPIREALAAELVSPRSTTDEGARAGVADAFTHASLDGTPTADGGETPIVTATASMAMVAAITNRVPDDRRAGP